MDRARVDARPLGSTHLNQDVFGSDAMMQSGEGRMLSFFNSALPICPGRLRAGAFSVSITVISSPALKIGEAGINTTVSNVEHNSHRLGHNG